MSKVLLIFLLFSYVLYTCTLKFNINEIYTLKSNNKITNNDNFNYIVGPTHLRRHFQRVINKRIHILEQAKARHIELNNQIDILYNKQTTSKDEIAIKQLKYEKLYYKDIITHLTKEMYDQSTTTATTSNSTTINNSIIELGIGGFGKVLFGHCLSTQKEIAIKIAKLSDYKELLQEYTLLHKLNNKGESRGEIGFPNVYYYFGQQEVLNSGVHMVRVCMAAY